MIRSREWRIWIRSLLMHRLRSFLSTLGVLFGVAAVIAMLSIGEGAKQETLEQIQQLGVHTVIVRQHALPDRSEAYADNQQGSVLSWHDVELLEQHHPLIKSIAPMRVIAPSLAFSSLQFSPEVLATTRSFGEMKQFRLAEGRFLCDFDLNEKKQVCVLGYGAAKALGARGHVGGSIQLNNTPHEIVGILKSTEWRGSKNQAIASRNYDNVLFIPLHGSASTLEGQLDEIIIQLQDAAAIDPGVKLIRHILARSHGGFLNYQIIVPQELLQQAAQTQETFNWVLGSMGMITLLVGGIGIMNIMLANVSERTREIGIRRAVGATKRHILFQFLFEGLLLSFIGACCGVFLGVVLSFTIASIAGWKTAVTLWAVVIALMMSMGVGLAAGLYPACQAAAMDPIKALRYE